MVNFLTAALVRLNLVQICTYIKFIYKLLAIACPKIKGAYTAPAPRRMARCRRCKLIVPNDRALLCAHSQRSQPSEV